MTDNGTALMIDAADSCAAALRAVLPFIPTTNPARISITRALAKYDHAAAEYLAGMEATNA